MTTSPELPFADRPRTTDVPFNEFEAWCRDHQNDIKFGLTVKDGHYRVTWKPGEQVDNAARIVE